MAEGSESRPKPLYRITTFFRKRPDISEEQFYYHWNKIHGPLCAPWALHHGFVEYTQYHTPSELKSVLAGGGKDGTFKVSSDFDAAADFYVERYEQYLDAFKDPYYVEVISKDEDKFVDKGQCDGKRDAGSSTANTSSVVRAISTMGINRSIIRDGKVLVEVQPEIEQTFLEWRKKDSM